MHSHSMSNEESVETANIINTLRGILAIFVLFISASCQLYKSHYIDSYQPLCL